MTKEIFSTGTPTGSRIRKIQLQYRPDHLTKLMQEGTVKIVVYDSRKETLSEARASCLVEVADEHK